MRGRGGEEGMTGLTGLCPPPAPPLPNSEVLSARGRPIFSVVISRLFIIIALLLGGGLVALTGAQRNAAGWEREERKVTSVGIALGRGVQKSSAEEPSWQTLG